VGRAASKFNHYLFLEKGTRELVSPEKLKINDTRPEGGTTIKGDENANGNHVQGKKSGPPHVHLKINTYLF